LLDGSPNRFHLGDLKMVSNQTVVPPVGFHISFSARLYLAALIKRYLNPRSKLDADPDLIRRISLASPTPSIAVEAHGRTSLHTLLLILHALC
jgi:hypothetical protein